MSLPRGRRTAILAALLVTATATAGWLLVLGRRGGAVPIARAADQNVLLVTIDTLRADALGCDGGPASTPALDALAAEGVRYTFAHAHAVMTLPSHASILTGRYPFAHGVRDNSGFRLDAGTPTLATRLKAAGFATGAFIGAFPLERRFGLSGGFGVYDDRLPAGLSGAVDLVLPERRADAVVAAARDWMARQNGRWFAWVHVFDPHAPYRPPAPYDARYAGREYFGEVAFTDHALAPLLDTARESSRPTLVIVTGDHGEALGDHGELTHGVFAYEATLRVPLILAQVGAGAHRAGRVEDAPARHVDLLPTVLDALGLPADPALPGRSLIAEDSEPRDAYFEAMMPSLTRGWAPLTGVLSGRRKWIDLPIPELYDLGADAAETQNLADREFDSRRALEARLRAFGPTAPAAAQPEDPEAVARLRALGYTSGAAPRKARYGEEDDPKRLIDLDRAQHEGLDLYEQHRFADAAAAFAGIVERRPGMSSAWRYLALARWDAGDRRAAVRTLETAMARGIAPEEIRRQLALYLAESGQPQRAMAVLETTASDPDTLNALGIALARAGNARGARDTFARVLREQPSNAIALQNLATLDLDAGDADAAARHLERAIQADPHLGEAWTGLGVARMRQGRPEEAFQAWRRAVEIDSRNFDALYNLGSELVRAGRAEQAVPYLQQFVTTAPPSVYGAEIARIRTFLQGRER